ncbi:unnamed protein product [Notodromas monacha]|uniref:Uncharacterized protein n=1 Tax=Notodromas monacha TaxID=399045 RepID=A0A7R9BTQ1_9CRUS|nr:unnamed protein product [Notodromas monacha]CAG0921563.1 unnamed protein product [Notodromas monacha]
MEIESRLYIYLLAAGVSLLVILQAVNGQQVPPIHGPPSAPVQPYPGTNMDPNARFGQQHGGDQQQVGYFTKNNQLNPANDTRLQQQETSSPLSGGAAQSAGRNPSDEPSAASAGSPQEAPPEVFIAGIGLLTAALHFLM